eukprot:3264097-Pleurochrysis_carterae.AAC.1
MGRSVIIDDNMCAGQPEHCVPSAFEEHDDNGCVPRGLRDIGLARGGQGKGTKRRRVRILERTEEQKRAKRGNAGRALYMDSEDD